MPGQPYGAGLSPVNGPVFTVPGRIMYIYTDNQPTEVIE